MVKRSAPFYLLSCVLVWFMISSVSAVTDEDKQVYVVYMGSLPSRLEYTPMSHHMSILQEVTGESSIEGRLVRSYKRSFNGFAARLTESEMERVATSNTNRGFVNKVLGNGKTIEGKSVNAFDLKGKKYPLVYGKSAASPACDTDSAKKCLARCLDESLVKGKILVCASSDGLSIAHSMGAVASIIINLSDYASIHAIPFSALLPEDFDLLVSYINSTRSPEAASEPKTIFNQTAPNVVSFSGRGPNRIASDILKPDITAPGVEILAAYSHVASPVPPYKQENDTRRVNYAVLAGTSMACPHAAGVAAYVKTFYPEWTPSMIKSAMMTTDKNNNNAFLFHNSGELLDSIKFEALDDNKRNRSRPQRTPGQHIEIDIMILYLYSSIYNNY
ncbi:unnamed protein product [Brassica oleracea]